jgi:hypothetical protein
MGRLPFGAPREYAERVVTDLAEVRRLGEAKAEENLEFRRYLSEHHRHIEPFQTLAEEIRRRIDCTTCANCCRCLEVALRDGDVERIGGYLGMTKEAVTQRYTAPDPDASALRILKSRKDACVFLDGTLCTIYEARPQTCREFPHLAPGTHSLGGRAPSICRRAAVCPIVFNALERYKHQVGYHPAGRYAVAGREIRHGRGATG